MKIARTFQTEKRSELQDRVIFNLREGRIVEKNRQLDVYLQRPKFSN